MLTSVVIKGSKLKLYEIFHILQNNYTQKAENHSEGEYIGNENLHLLLIRM